MATKTKNKSYHKGPGSKSYKKRSNPGTKHHSGGHVHHVHQQKTYKRKNPGLTGNIGEIVTNATFVIVGALGSKLGAQLILGTNNTGVVGYAGNLFVGGVLSFLAHSVLKNKTAASGIIAGTVAQLILRLINDYTPFGSYVSQLGMGDYQMQSFVTPQILVDPTRNSDLMIPNGWGAPAALPAPALIAHAATGMGGTYDNMGGFMGRSTY